MEVDWMPEEIKVCDTKTILGKLKEMACRDKHPKLIPDVIDAQSNSRWREWTLSQSLQSSRVCLGTVWSSQTRGLHDSKGHRMVKFCLGYS